MGDNGSGNNNFATTNVVSLCSLVSVAQKKEKENNKQIGTNKDKKKKKNCNWGPLGNMKEGF
jgi:hypothetical protein